MRHSTEYGQRRFGFNVNASSDGGGIVQLVLSHGDDEVLPVDMDSDSARNLGMALIEGAVRSTIPVVGSDSSDGD